MILYIELYPGEECHLFTVHTCTVFTSKPTTDQFVTVKYVWQALGTCFFMKTACLICDNHGPSTEHAMFCWFCSSTVVIIKGKLLCYYFLCLLGRTRRQAFKMINVNMMLIWKVVGGQRSLPQYTVSGFPLFSRDHFPGLFQWQGSRLICSSLWKTDVNEWMNAVYGYNLSMKSCLEIILFLLESPLCSMLGKCYVNIIYHYHYY